MTLWRLNEKQKEALKLIKNHKFSLLVGQGRSSKTTLMIWYMFSRAWKYPNTSHVIFRNTLASAKDGIWGQTIKEVIQHFYPLLPALENFTINNSSNTIFFPNGSRIMIRGLDTPERATKVLSQQFATVGLDEAMTIDYSYFALLLTRLPQPKEAKYKTKIICTANYAPKTNWNRVFFVDGKNPENKAKHNLDCGFLKFNTEDNQAINSKEYLETLNAAGDRKARLMCSGTDWYDEIEGALWKQDDIVIVKKLKLNEYRDIIIAFDPATTNNKNSDEHGVCVLGKTEDNQIHILEAYEKKADVNDIAIEVIKYYHTYECSKVVVEVNNGGDWIPRLIENHDSSIYCDTVRGTRGKITRAEPVAAAYKNKIVKHCGDFKDLTDQMLTYTGRGDSPNALDALVWGVTYFSSENKKYVNPDLI